MDYPLHYTEFHYGSDHELQRLGVWELTPSTEPSATAAGPGPRPKYWVVYLHGGAWRDPRIQLESGLPTFRRLLEPSSPISASRIAGFASIDYRLSPHPLFPQPVDTPPTELRAACHPDHLSDIRSGLAFLQDKFHMGPNYIVVGHSAGAFLGLQLPMGSVALAPHDGASVPDLTLPACIVGIEGIYDLRGVAERADGALDEILTGAFGTDRAVWDKVSPGRFHGFKEGWNQGKGLAVLAYSPEDELIDGEEINTMESVLRNNGMRVLAFRDLKGKHDEVREDGRGIARVVGIAIAELDRLGHAARQELKGMNMRAVE